MSLLDQCSASETIDLDAVYYAMGLAGNRRTAALMDTVLKHQTEKAIRDFNSLWMDGKDPAVLLSELTGLLRDTLMMKIAPKGGASLISGGYDGETLEKLGARMTKEEIIGAMETLQAAQTQIRAGTSPKTTAELCMVSLCDSALSDSVSSLKARISRLEEQIKDGIPVRPAAPTEQYAEELPPPPEEEYPEPASYTPVWEEIQAQEEPGTAAEPDIAEATPQPSQLPEPVRETHASTVSWREIAEKAAPMLPKDVSLRLSDEKSVRGWIEGQVLHVEVVSGFLYGRFNRPDVLSKLAEAAGSLTGQEMRAALSELTDKPIPTQSKRSLDDLGAFKEVRYI